MTPLPPLPPASAADRYAVLGHPVAHSLSPRIHAAFAQQTGQTLDYGRIDCAPDGFEHAVRGFAGAGARGCNVTVPFKFEALALAARCSERAALAGAANTLRFDAEGWWADNTDGIGLVRDIEQGDDDDTEAGSDAAPLAGRRVLLIGAGGAAAGVLGPLLAARPAELVLVNRSAERAHALVDRHRAWAAAHGVALTAAPLSAPGAAYQVVVNASASSLAGAAPPVPASVLTPGARAIDLMYGPAAEAFLQWARAAGADARDGLGMLVQQAAEAFFAWRGVRPAVAPVLRQLRTDEAAR